MVNHILIIGYPRWLVDLQESLLAGYGIAGAEMYFRDKNMRFIRTVKRIQAKQPFQLQVIWLSPKESR